MKNTLTKTITYLSGSASALCLMGAAASADIVQADDVIVQFSLCVGSDCVNGESFGFDTVILKENNLRVFFNDTSSTGSFPSNDWRLTANSSDSGGDSYFSIDDATAGRTVFRVDAGAIANALYVDSEGDVGVGTSAPVVELHAVDGNTPALRLEQNASSGFAAQTWDVAGNETNFFVRDVTNSSNIPFKIKPAAPTNSLFVAANGDIGLGTQTPSEKLHMIGGNILVENPGPANITLDHTGDSANSFRIQVNNTARFSFAGSGQIEMELTSAGDLTTAGSVSATGFIANGTGLNVPDYVFSDDYDLMPLSEVASFIKANSHLPNIPSAKEINSGHLDLTKMQLALLEKVEELTLYTLDQQSQIASLEARLEAATALK